MLALVKQAVRSILRRNSHVKATPHYHFLVVHDCSVNDLPTIFICSTLCIQWRRTFIYCAEDLMGLLFCVSAEFCTSKFRWPHFGGSGRVWRHANCCVTTYRPPASSHCTGRGICCFGSFLSNCSNVSLSGLFFFPILSFLLSSGDETVVHINFWVVVYHLLRSKNFKNINCHQKNTCESGGGGFFSMFFFKNKLASTIKD